MNFIEVTRENGSKRLVNFDYVVDIGVVNDRIILWYANEDSLTITETYDEIKSFLEVT